MIWCPRQMPNTGTLPSSAAHVARARTSTGRRDRRDRSRGTRRRVRARARPPPASTAGTTSTWQPACDELVEDRPLDAEVVRDHEERARRRDRPCTARGVVTLGDEIRPSVPPSACAAASSTSRSATPNAPGIAPALRMWRVSRRVSIPAMPATLMALEEACRGRRWRASSTTGAARSRTMTPRQCGAGGLVVVAVDAVVADVRVGEGDDLARVRRVGDDLLVARRARC